LSKETIKSIIGGNTIAVESVLQQLYTYDQTILAFPTVAGPEFNIGRNNKAHTHGTEQKDRGRNEPTGSISQTIVNDARSISKHATALLNNPAGKRVFGDKNKETDELEDLDYFTGIDPESIKKRR